MKIGIMVIFRHFENWGFWGYLTILWFAPIFFLEIIGPYEKVKQEFSLDSKNFKRLYHRAWTVILKYNTMLVQIWVAILEDIVLK